MKSEEERKAALINAWPEYPLARDMKNSPCQEPEWPRVARADIPAFEDAWRAREAGRLYKTIDPDGVVYLIHNPAVAPINIGDNGAPVVVRVKPRRLGRAADYCVSDSPQKQQRKSNRVI